MPGKNQQISKTSYVYILVFMCWVTLSTSVYATMLADRSRVEEGDSIHVVGKGADKILQTLGEPQSESEQVASEEPYKIRIFNELGEEVFSWFVDPKEGISDINLLKYLNKSSFLLEQNGVHFYLFKEE